MKKYLNLIKLLISIIILIVLFNFIDFNLFIIALKQSKKIFLRHDVDLSLEKALEMAKIECELGVKSTYMVIPNSSIYDIRSFTAGKILQQILAMGHEIALHFDVGKNRKGDFSISTIKTEINFAAQEIEKITGQAIKSLSFHRPLLRFIGGDLFIENRVNAYAKELMVEYFSDSKGVWRRGEPIPELKKAPQQLVQLLIHPIWWNEEHMNPDASLQKLFKEKTKMLTPSLVRAFDAALSETVPAVKRK